MTLGTTVVTFSGFDERTALRIICGGFFLPHLVMTLRDLPSAHAFFRAVGIERTKFLVPFYLTVEAFIAAALLLDFATWWVSMMAIAFLLTAAACVLKLSRAWVWNRGGPEFLIFWSCCVMLLAATY